MAVNERQQARGPPCYRPRVKIAVVIPALDESAEIAGAIASASAPGVQVVVVDGGSRDDTAGRARALGAEVISSPPGRARQLQRGFDHSRAEVVLFLHADTRLPPGWDVAVREALADPRVSGGAFRFAFDTSDTSDTSHTSSGKLGFALRLVELGTQMRHFAFGQPYGDQGIFVRRAVLEAIGGIPQVALMEDVDLVSAMKRHGRLARLSDPVLTSPRRYARHGVARTVFWHAVAVVARALGVERERIAGWLGR